jgi:hypothetical protein
MVLHVDNLQATIELAADALKEISERLGQLETTVREKNDEELRALLYMESSSINERLSAIHQTLRRLAEEQ